MVATNIQTWRSVCTNTFVYVRTCGCARGRLGVRAAGGIECGVCSRADWSIRLHPLGLKCTSVLQGLGKTLYVYIYGGRGCLTRSIKVCESHNIDKQAKAASVALEKDLVPPQPSQPRSKAEKKWKFLNRFVGDSRSALVGFLRDLGTVQSFAKCLAGSSVS